MFRNYLKTAFRTFSKHRAYTTINVAGLAIGITAFILISAYVQYENSFDRIHNEGDRIYRVESQFYKDKELTDDWATSSNGYVSAMMNHFPEIESYARVSMQDDERVIKYGDLKFREENVFFADSNFFSFFSYPLIAGDVNTVLKEPNTIALSESAAKKYFGETDPVGKFLDVAIRHRTYRCMVSGMFKDIPANSTLQFNLLLSWSTQSQWMKDFWYQHNSYSFVKLKPGADPAIVESKFPALAEQYKTAPALKELQWAVQLVPLTDIHLNTAKQYEVEVKGNRKAVQYLYIIGFVILLIASVNYVNLTTARSLERAKEVGVRKVSGAGRSELITQFFIESVLLNFFALLLATILSFAAAFYLLPAVGQQHIIAFLFHPALWGRILAIFCITIFISAAYPAVVLTNIEPISVLKGRFTFSPGSNLLRKVLVTFQFAASLLLIAGTIAVYRQLSYMNTQETGVRIDQTLVVKAPVLTDQYQQKIQSFKNIVQNTPAVQQVTLSGSVPGKKVGKFLACRRFSASTADERAFEMLKADFDFIKTYQLDVIAGRDFDATRMADSTGVIMNEAAVKQFGFASAEKAIGEKIWIEVNAGKPNEIIGVVKNYHQQSLQQDFTPIILFMDPDYNWIPSEYISIRLNAGNMLPLISGMEQTWASLFPESSFDHFFLDDYYNRQYKQEKEFGSIFLTFSVIAIFIACLGLFGLTAYSVVRRTKEIGIRKVLGASVFNITALLSSDTLKLIFTGSLIAIPLSVWIISGWMEGYAFRATLTWWQFALPVIMLAAIALLCTCFLIFKAAVMNPVKSLKN